MWNFISHLTGAFVFFISRIVRRFFFHISYARVRGENAAVNFSREKERKVFLLELKFGFNYVVSFVTAYLLHAIIFFVKNVTYILPLLYCA